MGCVSGVYRWEPQLGMDVFVTLLNKEDKRKTIATALTEAAGAVCQFEARIPGQSENHSSAGGEDEFLNTLRASFGADHVVVQQELK